MNYDRIILELLERVSVLEEEVRLLKSNKSTISPLTEQGESIEKSYSIPTSNGRDTTKYMLDGVRYGKNRLVLAIVKKYMESHPNTSASSLMLTFDKSLQGSLGVIRTVADVRISYSDSEKRFFLRNEEIIKTTTEPCAVCSQWGSFNINNAIARAKELGIDVKVLR